MENSTAGVCDLQNQADNAVPLQRAGAASPNRIPAQTQATLLQVAQRYGTPCYAYDIQRIRAQAEKLSAALPAEVDILYSLKANASLGVSQVLAGCGLGADVASAGEMVIAQSAGFPASQTFLTGPDKSPAVLNQLAQLADVVVSVDSVSELRLLAEANLPHRILLRMRPDFCSYATCSAGPDSRFGLTMDELPACRAYLKSTNVKVVGFHVFSGSQVLAVEGVGHHLREGLQLSLRAAAQLNIVPEIIDIGGGFGIPYSADECELDLKTIGAELAGLVAQAVPARIVIELGRYLVAQAGWYLTSVLAEQTHLGRCAVVVDGGSHQRTDMCGVGLRCKVAPLPLPQPLSAPLSATDVLGCLSLPADVLAENAPLPKLNRGDLLAFPTAGAYGLHAAPCLFHAHAAPAEVAFDGTELHLLRNREPLESVLSGQHLIK